MRNAANVLSAAFQGARSVFGWPYSSAIIVSIQRPRLAVITATARSRSSPQKPFSR